MTLLKTAAVAVVAVAALAACSTSRPAQPDAAPPPTTSSTAPAQRPNGDDCKAILQIVADGGADIAEDAVKSTEQNWNETKRDEQLRSRFAEMSKKVEKTAEAIEDPALQTAAEGMATDLARGGKAGDPGSFLDDDFQALGKEIDQACV